MEQYLIWKILGIEETKDEEEIKSAYRDKLSGVNPEEDQAGFMRLREAYEQAMDFARRDENNHDDIEELQNGSDVDKWIYKISRIYEDVDKRQDPANWQEAFEDEVCSDVLDTEAAERLLVYIMSHHYMPMEVWQTIDAKFHYVDDMELLKEKFPQDFLNYVQYKVGHEEFIDFTIFGGETTEHVDDYLYKYFDLKNLCDRSDGSNLDEIASAIKALDDYDTYYPYADAEIIRYYILAGDEEHIKKAVEKADALYSEYPDNSYIAYYCGEAMEKGGHVKEAEEIWQKLLDEDPDHYMAKYGIARIMADRGELAEAKEYCLDLLDIDDRNPDLRKLLDDLNDKLVVVYREKLSENADDFKITNKLAWCYFQMQDFKAVEELLNGVDEKYHEEYDYINLIGRNYLAMDEYDKAMEYLPRWREMIEETVDDGSTEAKKRLNRKGFAYFAIGFCQWNQNLVAEATENIYKSFELEDKFVTKLSYMDQMALFYLDAGSTEQAIEMCNRIIEMDRNYFPAYVKRQQAYFEEKNGQGIIDDFYECIRLYPGYVKPYVLAYKTFYFYRQYEDAAGILKRAEDAGLKSDEMELYRLKIQRVTKTGKENWQNTLNEVMQFRDKYLASLEKAKEKADGEGEEAESDLEEPGEIYLELSLLHWNLDDLQNALESVEEGIQKYGELDNLIWLKADILMDKKEYAEALGYYQKVCESNPDNANIHINIGKCLDKMGEEGVNDRAESALREYEKAYEINPRQSEVNFLIMRMYKRKFLRNSDKEFYKKAIFHADAQLEVSADAYYYIERGLMYEEGHELDKALADFLEAARLEPDNIYAHNNAGNVCRKMRKFDQALKEFEIALSLPNDKNSVWVYAGLADLYEIMGDFNKALEYTLKQLEKFPRSKGLLEDAARQYEKARNFRKAIETYRKLRSLGYLKECEMESKIAYCHFLEYTDMSEQHNLLKASSLCERMFIKEAARNGYLKAIKIAERAGSKKSICESYSSYGDFCYDIGKYEEALKAYNKCIAQAGESDKAEIKNRTYDIAETYYDMGNREQAAQYAKRFLEMMVETYQSYDNYVEGNRQYCPARAYFMAMGLLMAGDLEQAKKYQQIAMNSYVCHECHFGKCSEAHYCGGLIMEAMGDFRKAAELFEEALCIDPDYPKCKRALQRVSKKAGN